MCKFQSPSKYSPFDVITYWDIFSHCSKQFLNLSILMPFSASAIVCFHHLPIRKTFPFQDIFHLGKQKESLGVRLGKREGGAQGSYWFLVKNCWTLSAMWSGALVNHPSWNRQMRWKGLQKKLTEAKCSLSQQRQLVHWCRWVLRTLT